MEVAYISEFVEGHSVFREVDAPGLEHLIQVGGSMPLEAVYCPLILDGQLPELMTNAADYEAARDRPITEAVPIGAHLSVPLRDSNGRAVGMLCCLSRQPDPSLTQRDLQIMKVFADVTGRQFVAEIEAKKRARELRARVQDVIDRSAFDIAFQPIWNFSACRSVGLEALCRFPGEPYRPPNLWFDDAASAGLGIELELAAIEKALQYLPTIPHGLYLSVNASPETVLSGRLPALLTHHEARRLVLEVTEHAPVKDYAVLAAALAPLRAMGVGLAIDDAGAGFASLQHILSLKPTRIKLDNSLTRGIDSDPARRALTSALVFFAGETGAAIVAEGIETRDEFDTLMSLGVHKGQGYFLGVPGPLDQVLALIRAKQTSRLHTESAAAETSAS